MIFDWDLWPSLIAYESDWGQMERMRRGFARLGDAIRAAMIPAAQAQRAIQALGDALSHQPATRSTARR